MRWESQRVANRPLTFVSRSPGMMGVRLATTFGRRLAQRPIVTSGCLLK